jgi:hypothetical protein
VHHKTVFSRELLPTAVVVAVLGILLTYAVDLRGVLNYSVVQGFGTATQEVVQTDDIEDPEPLYTAQTHALYDNPGNPISRTVPIDELDHRLPVDAPLHGDPRLRDRATYDNVINQFAVEENPRYRSHENSAETYLRGVTYCNTFVWDVTRAMNVEIPYWVDENGEPTKPWFTDKGRWRVPDPVYWKSANDINQWLNQRGQRDGWHEVSSKEAQDLANQGYPTVASVYNLYGEGHIGIVRPGKMINGPALAQAGIHNVNYAHVYDFFPQEGTQFFVNDVGAVTGLD